MVTSCDYVTGPIVQLGESALIRADVSIVFPYVLREDEGELARMLASSRAGGRAPGALRDDQFITRLVQLHTSAEGAPASKIREEGPESSPVVPIAERALESGYHSALATLLPQTMRSELARRFAVVSAMHAQVRDPVTDRAYILSVHRFLVWVDRATAPKRPWRPWE